MKLTSYTKQVQPNTIGDVRVQAYNSGVPQAIANIGRMHGNALGALAQGIDSVRNAIVRQQEEQDTVNVVAANTEYRKRVNDVLYNPENGLMNTQM